MGLCEVQFGLRVKLEVPLQGREWKKAVFKRLQGNAVSLRGCIQLLGEDKGRARSTLLRGYKMNKENACCS